MIWFKEECQVKNQPPDSKVFLCGIYNPHSSAALIQIEISVYMPDNDTCDQRILYNHNPTSLRHEDPLAEDVLFKYRAKINKIMSRLSRTDFVDLMK